MRGAYVAVLAVVAAGSWAAETVPVQNPSFEDEQAQVTGPPQGDWEVGGAPPGWHHWIGTTAKPGNPVLMWDKTLGRTGMRSVSLSGCIGPVCVIQSVPAQPDETYRVRVWGRASNPATKCYFSVRWQDKDGKWLSGQLSDKLPTGVRALEWHEMQVSATAPEGAGLLVILLTADGQTDADKCWFDDLSVDKLGPGDIVISPCSWMPSLLHPEGEPPPTPHVKWAKPWARGTTRVLFILGSDHSLREPIELAQRMDIQYDYTFAHDYEQALYTLDHRRVQRRLEEGYYDVAVVATSADGDLSRALLDKLGQGKGIVFLSGGRVKLTPPAEPALTSAPADHWLKGSLGALPLPGETNATAIREIEMAQDAPGRVVRVSYSTPFRCLTPTHNYEDYLRMGATYWEGYLQTLIRAILWAAHREPAARATMSATDAGAALHMTMPAAEKLRARVWVTDRLNRDHPRRDREPRQPALPLEGHPPGEGPAVVVPVDRPEGCASGPAMFSAIVTDGEGKVVDFASCRLRHSREASIAAIGADKEYFLPGEEVQLTIQLDGMAEGLRLETTLSDIYGREVGRASAAARPGENPVAMTPRDHMSTLNWVSVRLLRDGTEIDAAKWYVLIPLPREPFLQEFQVGTWASTGYHPAYLHDAMLQAMKRAAITEGIEAPSAYVPTLAGGVWPVSYAYGTAPGFSRFKGPQTLRSPCLSDPQIRQKMAQTCEALAARERGYAPIFGYLRDETSLVQDGLDLDTCSSPHCQGRYREWLQEQYESLSELNAEWKTDYQSWDELGFVDYRQARESGNLAPWVMYRRFMDWVWADAVKWCSQGARKADPTALTALANSFGLNPFAGRDYRLLLQANDYTMEYPYEAFGSQPASYHFEAVRSFAPEKVHHPWIGYRHQEPALHYEPWWCALHGARGVSIYGCMSMFAGNNSWAQVYPTMQLTQRGRIYADECRELKRGVGRALITARRPGPDIAILWSQPSMYVACGLSGRGVHPRSTARGRTYRQYFHSRLAFRRACIASGRQFDYVCEEQIKQGILERYRCLVLPGSFAIGPRVCTRLRQFVQAGGLLIADQGVGITNEVGARYQDGGPVCDLFGIRRADGELSYEPAEVTAALPGCPEQTFTTQGHEKLVIAGDAGAYDDGSPAVVQHVLGQGRTVFLNLVAEDVPELRGLFEELPTLARIRQRESGGAPKGYEVVRLDRGDIHYYGILRDYRVTGEDYPVRVRLNEARGQHLYDVRGGLYLGATSTFDPRLQSGETALLACTPYKVTGLQFVGQQQARPGKTLRARLTVLADRQPGDHVLRIDVCKPGGEPAQAYSGSFLTTRGQADFTIPFAPNDPKGPWQVQVRDVLSGKTTQVTIELSA